MKKAIIFLTFVLLFVLVFSSCDGYLYIGDGWQDTPEKALKIAAENPIDKERLTVGTLLDTWYVDDMAFMLFVSKNDMLVKADFISDEKDRFHHHASSEEAMLDKPDTFILNGEADQFVLFPYSQYGNQVWGYKYSSVHITVNGLTPEVKTYTFSCQGHEWSIDRWCIDGIKENTEIHIEYVVE